MKATSFNHVSIHAVGLEVDDFEAAYLLARDRGMLDDDTFAPTVRELSDGSAQMYLGDPAGNSSKSTGPTSTRSTAVS
jgi:hypothetical protein